VKISATCTQADNSEFVVFTLEILIGAWWDFPLELLLAWSSQTVP
jgi:hypothetical protein